MLRVLMDIGNSRLKFWLYDIKQQQCIEQLSDLHLQSPIDLLKGFLPSLKRYQIQDVLISSVLTIEDNQAIQKLLQPYCQKIIFAKVHQQYGLLHTQYDIDRLGIDRWLQVLGAVAQQQMQFKSEQAYQEWVIVGCGTALTLDVVKNNQHVGGYIIPSLHLQRDALLENTRRIKNIHASFDTTTIGQTTSEAVHHGILYSIIATIVMMHIQYPKAQILLTGGDADVLLEQLQGHSLVNTQHVDVNQQLLLSGLNYYAQHDQRFNE